MEDSASNPQVNPAGVACAKNVLEEHDAVSEMEVGPYSSDRRDSERKEESISLKKIFITLAIIIFLVGGCASRAIVFTESNAVQQVLKDHPDFPSKVGETKTVKTPTGGPPRTTTMVEYKTTADKTADGKYLITLSKDWHLVVNGQRVFSYWKYSVGSKGVTPIESDDRDPLPDQIK